MNNGLMDDEWTVYFANCKELGTIKIGHAKNPFSRVSSIRVGCPYNLELYGFLILPSKNSAEFIEWMSHRALMHRRTRGEWFKADYVYAKRAIKKAVIGYSRLKMREKIKNSKVEIKITDFNNFNSHRDFFAKY
jgi:hypothetical protein